MNSDKRFYNCHAHCFTDAHVPEYFLSRLLPISWLLSKKWFIDFMYKSSHRNDLGFWGEKIVKLLHLFDSNITEDLVLRYMNFFVYDNVKGQMDVIEEMQRYYPTDTGLVMLSMDMEYMGAGKPKALLQQQLEELAKIKSKLPEIIYPFIHCDPRRIKPTHDREKAVEKEFIETNFLNTVFDYLTKRTFSGIKMYPALGYFPFDFRMKEIYDFALRENLPITTHCTVGAVHFKYKLDEAERKHPLLPHAFTDVKPVDFQYNFTHPLNYECLLNPNLIQQIWGKSDVDYSQLKICIAHWGGEQEWHDYIANAWSDLLFKFNETTPSLDLRNWVVDPKNSEYKNFSWFSVICDLIRKYPNVYADISYTLEDASLLPLLKLILETDEKIRSRVLFGTDFFLVSKSISEREFGINVRSVLGHDLFQQIAVTNAKEFLGIE